MMVFISNGKKLHVSAYSVHLQVLTTFLLTELPTNSLTQQTSHQT